MFHVNDLLDSKIVQSGKFFPVRTYQFVGRTIQEIIHMMQWTLKKRDLVIEFQNTQEDHYQLLFDKRRLQQVLLNLLSNAIKFQMQGKIKVSFDTVENTGVNREQGTDAQESILIKVIVQDEGIGMTESEVTTLFEPFHASQNITSKSLNPNGRGLGLFICKRICEHLGGKIEVVSEEGLGTKFIFTMEALIGMQHSDKDSELL